MGKKKADLATPVIDSEIAFMVMSSCCLGLLFHVNYVVIMFYGLLFLTAPTWSLYYYMNAEPFPWSVSTLFCSVTLIASSFVIATVWYKSREKSCKWRLRFFALLMSSISFGFAVFFDNREALAVEYTKHEIEFLKEERANEPEPFMQEILSKRISNTENQLKRLEDGKSGKLPESALQSY